MKLSLMNPAHLTRGIFLGLHLRSEAIRYARIISQNHLKRAASAGKLTLLGLET